MSCTSSVVKCGLNIINTLYAILGLLFLVLGFFLIDSAPKFYVIYVFVVASVVFGTAMLGCIGICKEHVCTMTFYTGILLGLLVLQVVGKFFTPDANGVKDFADKQISNVWAEEVLHPGAMNKTQITFQCCGKDGPDDYAAIKRLTIPLSCYPHQKFNVTALYKTGCTVAAEEHFGYFFNYSSAATWGTIAFTVVLVICAFYLLDRFKQRRERYSY